MSVVETVFAVLVGACALFFVLAKTVFRKRWGHDILGWHDCGDGDGFDGASFTGRCRYCGKRCLQDSQGNWFVPAEFRPEGGGAK